MPLHRASFSPLPLQQVVIVLLVLFLLPGCAFSAGLGEYAERISREFPPPESFSPDNAGSGHWGGEWGMQPPGVTTRLPAVDSTEPAPVPPKRIALTLDACGGRLDRKVISLLREYSIPATLFVTSIWLRANRDAAAELAADPLFSIQAHGAAHKPASVSGRAAYGIRGTRSVAELVAEVEENARAIAAITGKRPRWYRSGTAHYDAMAVKVIHHMGFRIAGFSINGDEGATAPPHEVRNRILAANDGDIILCHTNRPKSGTAAGLREVLPALLDAGVIFVFLPEN